LIKNKTLKILDISHNQIKEDSYSIISEALKQNHDLIEFRITGNEMRLDIDGNLFLPVNIKQDQ